MRQAKQHGTRTERIDVIEKMLAAQFLARLEKRK